MGIKGIVHQKVNLIWSFTLLVSFQTCITFFIRQNIKKRSFENALSICFYTIEVNKVESIYITLCVLLYTQSALQ